MTEAMAVYGMVFAKLAIGLLAIILQIYHAMQQSYNL